MNRISPWAILFTYFHKFVRITLITLRALRNKTERQHTHTYTHLHCDYYWKQWEILFELIHLFHLQTVWPDYESTSKSLCGKVKSTTSCSNDDSTVIDSSHNFSLSLPCWHSQLHELSECIRTCKYRQFFIKDRFIQNK